MSLNFTDKNPFHPPLLPKGKNQLMLRGSTPVLTMGKLLDIKTDSGIFRSRVISFKSGHYTFFHKDTKAVLRINQRDLYKHIGKGNIK